MGVPISSLPTASSLTGAELFPVVQAGQTKHSTIDAIPYVPTGAGAVATTVQSKLRETVSVKDFGAVGDGVTDDTAAIQAAIDANKGNTIFLPAGYSFYGAGILLSGSAYNNTKIVIEGEFKLKPAPTVSTSNFIACWAGIIFQDCDGCSIEGTLNGNRTNQQDKEQTYTLMLAGVTNFSIPKIYCKELRGDGVHVSQKIINASSKNSDGLTIGEIYGYNSAVDGRNLLTISSCDNASIGLIHSVNIGGTVGGAVMPGGLDIEPDWDFQSCKNITVGTINVVTAGGSGIGIAGRPGTLVTSNVVIGSATVINNCAPTVADEFSNITATNNHTLVVGNANDVQILNYHGQFASAWGDAVIVTNSDKVKINGTVVHVREGARIGGDVSDASGAGVTNSDISLHTDTINRYGIRTGKITNTRISGKATNPTSGYYSGSSFAVFSMGGYAQTNCVYSVSVPYHANWTRGYRNDNSFPATFFNTYIKNADFTPSESWANYIIMKDMAVPIYDSVGYTEGCTIGQPTTGPHIAGTYVKNGVPAVGSPKGWYCTVSGTPGTWVSEGNL